MGVWGCKKAASLDYFAVQKFIYPIQISLFNSSEAQLFVSAANINQNNQMKLNNKQIIFSFTKPVFRKNPLLHGSFFKRKPFRNPILTIT